MKKQYQIISIEKLTGKLKCDYANVYTLTELKNIIKYEYYSDSRLEVHGVRDSRNNPITLESLKI